MKLILTKKYNQKYRQSDLDYQKDVNQRKSDIFYLVLRNTVSSYNSYTIVDLIEDNEKQIISLETPILVIDYWDKDIFEMGEFFIQRYTHRPQILTANQKTLAEIDLAMNKKLKEEGREKDWKKLTSFDCSLFSLQVCVDDSLEDRYIKIIYDEQANFIPES